MDLHPTFERVDAYVQQWMRKAGVPGLALAVTDPQRILKLTALGYTDVASKSPVVHDTLFEIGSLGKPFTSIGLLQLRDEGMLGLHRPVADYLPWFEVRSRYAPITVHHLMNHTAGIVRGTDLAPHGLYEAWALRHTAASAAPGTYFSYSNVGYKVLGFLLEALTGQTYAEALQSRVLDPLGMTKTYPVITFETRKAGATGYAGFYDDRPEHPSHGVTPTIWAEYATGDGSPASTVEDMAVYLRMLLNKGIGRQGRLLSEDSFNLMALEGVWTGGDYYGYGLARYPSDGRNYVGHGGGNAGFRSAIVVDLEGGLGVVILVNRMGETDPVVDVAQNVLTAVREAALDRVTSALPAPVDETSVPDAEEYAGHYSSPDGKIRIVAEGGRLVLHHEDGPVVLEKHSRDAFYANSPEFALFLLEFARDASGAVVEAFHGPRWYVNDRYSGPRDCSSPLEWEAYPGHYRARSPELSNFRIVSRKGGLVLIIPWGTVEPLAAVGDGVFRIGEDARSPETLVFRSIVDGRALRVDYSGCPFYRAFTP